GTTSGGAGVAQALEYSASTEWTGGAARLRLRAEAPRPPFLRLRRHFVDKQAADRFLRLSGAARIHIHKFVTKCGGEVGSTPRLCAKGTGVRGLLKKVFLQWRIPYNVIKNVETWFISMKLNELSISQLLKIFRFPQKNVIILCANSTKHREVAQKPEL
ncbi:MAG: hypothetical protein AAF471_09600, partial [Myxococcota bacterium]